MIKSASLARSFRAHKEEESNHQKTPHHTKRKDKFLEEILI